MRKILRNVQFIIGVRTNQVSMVKKSLLNGADINYCVMQGKSALYMVIERRNLDLLKTLINHDVDVDFHKSNEYTPIEYACIYGNAEIVKQLVYAGCSLNYDKNEICQILAARDRIHTLEFLIDKGMRPDQQGWDGRTGLHWAVQEDHFRVVELLVERGADMDVMEEDGQTPLRIACGEGNINITKYLLENHAEVDLGVYDTPLQIASSMGYVEIVSLLLEFGAEVDWYDKDGRTALFYAKAHGQKKIEKMLKNHGADTGIIDRYGISIRDLDRKEMRKRVIWEI